MVAANIYFDGAYYDQTNEMFSMIVFNKVEFLYSTGAGASSTHAEWLSAITALEFAAERQFTDVILIGDSENVIGAMCGWLNAHDIQADLKKYVDDLCLDIGRVGWRRLPSAKNPAGAVLRGLGDLRLTPAQEIARARPTPVVDDQV